MKLAKSKKAKFVLNPILIGILGFSAQPLAEEYTDTVLVTANRSVQSISDVAATALVIEQEQIEEQAKAGVDLKALLANLVPSLDVGSQSRTNSRQHVRGRKALVMIDGVSLNSSRSISRQFDSINPFNIARIEVIAGATSIYGAGSTGGIINIITKKGHDAYGLSETWLGAKSGFNQSNDLEWQVAQAVSGSNEKTDGRFAISYTDTGAYYDADGDMILQDVTQTSTQFVRQIDMMANFGYNLSSSKRIELMGQYYDSGQNSDYGVDYGPGYSYALDPSKEIQMAKGYTLEDQAESVRTLLTANYSDSDFYGQTLNLQLFHRTEAMRFNPFPDLRTYGYLLKKGLGALDSIVTLSASEQNTQVMGAKLVFTAAPVSELNLVYGADFDLETFDATQSMYDFQTGKSSNGLVHDKIGETGRYPDVDNTSYAAFLQADYQLTEALNINGGIRYQYTNTEVSDFVAVKQQYMILQGAYDSADEVAGGEKDYENTLFNVGALYKITREQQLWFSFAQGFEVPDPAKYYGNGTYDDLTVAPGVSLPGYGNNLIKGVSVAESPLSGVKTDGLELGWRLNQYSLSAQLAAYISQSDKTIKYDSVAQTVDVIDDDKRIYGLEGQLDYYVTPELSLGGHFNYIVSETKADGEWQDLEIIYASPSKASAYVAWQSDQWQARLQSMQMFNYEDSNNDKLEGYNTVDLLTGVTLPVGALQVGISNLLNTDYETLWSQRAQKLYGVANVSTFKGQGRTYAVNYSVEF